MRTAEKLQGPFGVDVPGKVTLHLRILGRLPDGYHDVRIAMVPVTVFDRLSFSMGGEAGVRLTVEGDDALGLPRDNLIVRAAHTFQAAWGGTLAVTVHLRKGIPSAAGLGGGSADAAATLVALNRWLGHPVGPDRLHALAASLGADVPFFLEPKPSWAEGRGEALRPLGALPVLELLLVKPRFSIATGAAYAAAKAEAAGGAAPPEDQLDPDFRSLGGVVDGLFNAFEPALLPLHPQLGEMRDTLLRAGALGALLSGSGSTVFGVFSDRETRDLALGALKVTAADREWALLPCRTLQRHRYDFIF